VTKRTAWKVRQILEPALEEIKSLDPTTEEIVEYAEKEAGWGVVTYTGSENYYRPHLHDTWGIKYQGRVHIDIGAGGYHLMLDKYSAFDFIDFIKSKRQGGGR